MEKKFNYLYKITNNINNKFYYGIHSTNKLNDNYMGSGKRLHEAYNKYGINNFTKEIICFKSTRQEISDLEREIVDINLINNENCYNICLGGGNLPINKGRHHTDQERYNLSKALHKDDKDLKFKRRIMAKDGILKSIPINEIDKYLLNGWTFDRRGAKYKHTRKEYNKIRKDAKNKNIEIQKEKSKTYQNNKILKRNTIKEFISVNIKNIDINKFGWIDKLSKLIPGYSKKEIIHVLELDFQYILNNAKLNNINPENKQVWVYNEFECKRIKIDKLNSYLNNGYFRGRKKF